nr:glycine-rich cell wall structural protein 1 [Ipomoea batatas]
MNGGDDEEKGLLWKLPAIKSRELGKLGPGFGVGIGCGFGFGVGLIGGTGFGPGIPGLQLGFGLGAGCGVGLGFGYAVGRGIAYDDSRRYSNVGRFFDRNANFPTQNEIDTLIDDLVVNTKKLIRATSHEVDKWKRGRW